MFRLMGSKYFFEGMEDFVPHDTDMWEIIETTDFQWVRVIRGQGMDYFQFRKLDNAEEYIDYAVSTELPMTVGKFLVPEFCEEIGLTFEEFKNSEKLKTLIEKLDEKHKYEEIIYKSYLKNKAFRLTKGQRQKAYESYKASRKPEIEEK